MPPEAVAKEWGWGIPRKNDCPPGASSLYVEWRMCVKEKPGVSLFVYVLIDVPPCI
jgi:hypothetical protein